jgi:metal-responsive CopG/Arc/MetJ family transcriptional regulator
MAKQPDEPEHMTERIIIPVTPAMSEDIKNFWHDRRLNSKSEAVRLLIQSGLEAERKKQKR